jgi:hypothetical protein
VTALNSKLRINKYEVPWKLVIWRYVLGACELIHIFVCKERNCNRYTENIMRKIKKSIYIYIYILRGHQIPGIFLTRGTFCFRNEL